MNYDEKIVKESASLEEATTKICCYGFYDTKGVSKEDVLKYMRLGALWQKQQMMKDAVEGVIHHFADNELAAVHYNDPKGTPMSIYVSSKGLSAGDKVKIILIKEENK